MSIRREALYGFVEELPEAATERLHAALLDPHASMREMARFYLRKLGEQDFAGFYRVRLEQGAHAQLATVISGLGETGVAEDANQVVKFLGYPMVRVRRAAVRSLGRLDAGGNVENLVTMLQDPASSVAKAARDVFLAKQNLLSGQRLGAIYQSTRLPRVCQIAVSLIAHLGWWESCAIPDRGRWF